MTTANPASPLQAFQWQPQPRAEALITGLAEEFLTESEFARELKRRLHAEAGVRFIDLIDSIHVPRGISRHDALSEAGFIRRPIAGAEDRYVQEQGIFPAVVLHDARQTSVRLKAESVSDFLSAWQSSVAIEGSPLAPMRRAPVDAAGRLWVVERHGYRGFEVRDATPAEAVAALHHYDMLRWRRRVFSRDDDGFAHTHKLIDAAIADLGVDRTCDLFFAAEREYWQRRNRAAQVQKARQDKLGIGWANHDHHTYRSSREDFASLIAVFQNLGFHCRERFYAGHQTGWGAQILEQPNAGIVIFADVDLSPDELFDDFAHDGLPPRDKLGTVGLWCALHGEAFLEAGMHHLECQFDFDALKRQLESSEGVKVMTPFTDFSYLRQAFTEGEIWPVRPERIEKLLRSGRISDEQATHFRQNGALGSHLENLERNQGFKGFNQTGVSEIIARTDPRAGVGRL